MSHHGVRCAICGGLTKTALLQIALLPLTICNLCREWYLKDGVLILETDISLSLGGTPSGRRLVLHLNAWPTIFKCPTPSDHIATIPPSVMDYIIREDALPAEACLYKGVKGWWRSQRSQEESRRLQSEKSRRYWQNPEVREKVRAAWSTPEYRERMSGERSPRWRGGASFYPYCPKFNKAFKERVREFWGRTCCLCLAPENGQRLSVHHVHANKEACCDERSPRQFVALCASCHSKAGGKGARAEEYRVHFQEMIALRGGRSY